MVDVEECVLLISDTHIGRCTRSYNSDIFRARLRNLRDNLFKVKQIINRSYKLPVLNIFFLGDIIDGEDIYPSQPYKQDLDADDQLDLAVNEFSNFIRAMLPANSKRRFKEIKVWCAQGNHGRAGRRKSEKTNFDRVFYKRLADRFEQNSNVHINLADEWYNIAEVYGHKYLLFHGDGIYMYQSIPWYGIIQRAMRLKSGGIDENSFDVVCLGHFHTVGDQFWNDIRVLLNGTFVTDDDFAQKRLGMKTVSKFWFFGVSEERAMTWSYLLDLARLG